MGLHGNVEEKKIEREEEVRESEFTKTRIFLWENVANADDIVRKLLEAEVSNSYFDNLSDMFLKLAFSFTLMYFWFFFLLAYALNYNYK